MNITNTTDRAGNAPKVIGFGSRLFAQPGETIQIPDRIAYCDEYDEDGNKTGRTKTAKAEPVKEEAPAEEAAADAAAEPEKKPARGGRTKKAE